MFYCEFEYTNQTFREKKIYKCKYCGTQLALDDPDAKVICFMRQNAFYDNIDNIYMTISHAFSGNLLGHH